MNKKTLLTLAALVVAYMIYQKMQASAVLNRDLVGPPAPAPGPSPSYPAGILAV